MHEIGTMRVKSGLAEMLKGGVIMDVVDAEQAKIAEDAGACAVMALERVPADIRRDGGVARMSDPEMIGTSRETLTKVLNEFREAGLIDVRDRLIWVLDADGLESLIAH